MRPVYDSERDERTGSPRVTVTVFGLTDMGKVRTNNEDAFLVSDLADAGGAKRSRRPPALHTFEATEHAVLLAVSDGMGGADAGEVASALVVESLRRAMSEAEGKLDWNEATKQAVERANREVWSAARAPGRKGMGATVTAVCLQGDHAHIAEVGDSRAYLLRDARIRQVTRDQSFVQYLVDAGALKPEEAANYPMKNVVLQAMGQSPTCRWRSAGSSCAAATSSCSAPTASRARSTREEMLARVQQASSLEAACRALVDLANERGGDDNITVILARVDGDGAEHPAGSGVAHADLPGPRRVQGRRAAGLGHDDERRRGRGGRRRDGPRSPPRRPRQRCSRPRRAPPRARRLRRLRPRAGIDLQAHRQPPWLVGLVVGALVLLLQRL